MDPQLNMPLGFEWASWQPVAGKGFDTWKSELQLSDSLNNIIVFKSYFFRDEANSVEEGKELAKRRVEQVFGFTRIDRDNTMVEILTSDVISDARAKPFDAVRYEILEKKDVLRITRDTIEVCFPLKDSIMLPPYLIKRLDEWLEHNENTVDGKLNITGTADGTGISEPADTGWERAQKVKEQLFEKGWTNDIVLNTGQRSLGNSIRNRCVVLFFE